MFLKHSQNIKGRITTSVQYRWDGRTHSHWVHTLQRNTFPFTYTPTTEQINNKLRWNAVCRDLQETQNVHVFSAALRYSYQQYKDCIFAATDDIIQQK